MRIVALLAVASTRVVAAYDTVRASFTDGTTSTERGFVEIGAQRITAQLDAFSVQCGVNASGSPIILTNLTGMSWHIHEKWTHTDAVGRVGPTDCGPAFTGGHYDPTFACGPASQHRKMVDGTNAGACASLPFAPAAACKKEEDKCFERGCVGPSSASLDEGISAYTCSPTSAGYIAQPFQCEVGDMSGKFGGVTMESDKFVLVREETGGTKTLVIINLATGAVQRKNMGAESVIMNPEQQIIALRGKSLGARCPPWRWLQRWCERETVELRKRAWRAQGRTKRRSLLLPRNSPPPLTPSLSLLSLSLHHHRLLPSRSPRPPVAQHTLLNHKTHNSWRQHPGVRSRLEHEDLLVHDGRRRRQVLDVAHAQGRRHRHRRRCLPLDDGHRRSRQDV